MFKKINKYVFDLTKENWGFPYHIILGAFLAKLVLIAMSFAVLPEGYEFYSSMIALVVVNLVGYINEVLQKSTRRDFIQDTIGNNIGWILGVF